MVTVSVILRKALPEDPQQLESDSPREGRKAAQRTSGINQMLDAPTNARISGQRFKEKQNMCMIPKYQPPNNY